MGLDNPQEPQTTSTNGAQKPGEGPKDAAFKLKFCTVCASTFPVRDGIPVLLVDEATPGPRGLGQPAG